MVRVAAEAKRVVRGLGITRQRAALARTYAERAALARVRRTRPEPPAHPPGRILCYHSFGQAAYGINDVKPGDFRSQIEQALSLGHRFVAPATIAGGQGQTGDLAVTFDDGLTSVLDAAAPVLHEFGVPSICFVVTSWADQATDWARDHALDWAGVRALRDAGVEIGSHSISHPDFGQLPATEAREQLVRSKDALEQHLGAPVPEFAIPFGQSRNWSGALTEMAHDVGYTTVYAQSEHRRPLGTTPRTFITSVDNDRRFRAALDGAYDWWEEWL
jgi:peptidoglycan/xylan/chitin deacetylase (PgdA/CDA1 family)